MSVMGIYLQHNIFSCNETYMVFQPSMCRGEKPINKLLKSPLQGPPHMVHTVQKSIKVGHLCVFRYMTLCGLNKMN